MDEKQLEYYRQVQEQNARNQANMMREMGIDPEDNAYEDPELAALDKMLKKQGKGGNGDLEDDDALMAELEGYGSEDDEIVKPKQSAFDPKKKEAELKDAIGAAKAKAVKARDAGDKQTAITYLKKSKQLNEELKQLQEKYAAQLSGKAQPKARAQPAPVASSEESGALQGDEDMIELEDRFHDPDEMVSMSVIEHEAKYLQVLVQRYKNNPDEKDFFQSKIESLNFAKSSIETNIQTGILTPESYIANVKKYGQKVNVLYQQASKTFGQKNEHSQRLLKRAQLIKSELAEMEQGVQEQEEAEVQAQQEEVKKPAAAPKSTSGMDDDKKQMIIKLLSERVEDLTHACQYNMKELQNKEHAVKLLNEAELGKGLIEKIKLGGQVGKEDIQKCPAVTPEHMFGYSEQQRLNQINEAYSLMGQEQNDLVAHIKELTGKRAQCKTKQQLQALQAEIADLTNKAKEKKVQLQKIAALKQNKYQPPPIVGDISVQKEKEKINEELEPNQVKVVIRNTDSLKKSGGSYLSYKVFFEEGQKCKSKLQLDKEEIEHVYTLSSVNSVKHVQNCKFFFKLKKKKILRKVELDTADFMMSGFILKSEVAKKVSIHGAQFMIIVTIYKSIKGTETVMVTETSTGIKSIPAAYQPIQRAAQKAAPAQQKAPQQPVQKQVAPAASKQGQPQQQARTQPAAVAQKKPAVSSGALPEGVSAEDIKDPENMTNLNCMSLLEKKVPQFKAVIDKAIAEGTRPTPAMRSKWMEANKRMMQIQNACGNGSMTPEQYIELQQDQVVKDKAMLAYFKQTGDLKKAAIVTERLQIIMAELKDMQG